MDWKIANELQDGLGVEWAQQRFAEYDWTQCEWITVRRGEWNGHSVKGLCRFPSGTRSGLYRLNCSVNARKGWPGYVHQRVSPLYRNGDGTWPEVPFGHILGERWEDWETGREWIRMYRLVPLETEDVGLVYIIAHEAYHYLRRTRQIPGRNAEIEADAFGMEILGEFRQTWQYEVETFDYADYVT